MFKILIVLKLSYGISFTLIARKPYFVLPYVPQDVIQHGSNRQVCFLSDEYYAAYAHWLHEYSKNIDEFYAPKFLFQDVYFLI